MPTRRTQEPAKKRQFIPTCGQCDDGWRHELWEVTTWKQDGRKHSKQVPYKWPKPASWDGKDRWVNYYSAVRRCPCFTVEIVGRKELPESLVEMPVEIASTTIGAIAKRMP